MDQKIKGSVNDQSPKELGEKSGSKTPLGNWGAYEGMPLKYEQADEASFLNPTENAENIDSLRSSIRFGQNLYPRRNYEDEIEMSGTIGPLKKSQFQDEYYDSEKQTEYDRMKKQFYENLHFQKRRITNSISLGKSVRSDIHLRKQAAINVLNTHRKAEGSSITHIQELSSIFEPSEASKAATARNYHISLMPREENPQTSVPKIVYKRRIVPAKQPPPGRPSWRE